jgi:hypothetical protein
MMAIEAEWARRSRPARAAGRAASGVAMAVGRMRDRIGWSDKGGPLTSFQRTHLTSFVIPAQAGIHFPAWAEHPAPTSSPRQPELGGSRKFHRLPHPSVPARRALSPGGRGRATRSGDRVRGSESPQLPSLLPHRPPHPPACGGSPLPVVSLYGERQAFAFGERAIQCGWLSQGSPMGEGRRHHPRTCTKVRLRQEFSKNASLAPCWIPAFAGMTAVPGGNLSTLNEPAIVSGGSPLCHAASALCRAWRDAVLPTP